MSLKSLRSHEGYLMIDNRCSQGIDDATMLKLGYPQGAGKGLFETATYTCSHCNAVVIMEQQRTRPRAFCRGCGQRICDACELIKSQTLECRSMDRIADEVMEAAVTGNRLVLGDPT